MQPTIKASPSKGARIASVRSRVRPSFSRMPPKVMLAAARRKSLRRYPTPAPGQLVPRGGAARAGQYRRNGRMTVKGGNQAKGPHRSTNTPST